MWAGHVISFPECGYLKDLDDACLVFLELEVDQCANSSIGDVGIRDSDRRVEVFEDITQSLVFSNTKRLVRINNPFDQEMPEAALIKGAYDRVGDRLFSRSRRVEL